MAEDRRLSASLSRRSLNISLLAAAVTPACAAEGAGAAGGPVRLRRGIGVHNVMNWPDLEPGSQHRFVWPPYADANHLISDAEIANIRAVGFDFVRLTIGPEIFLASEGARGRELLDILRRTVARFRAGDLNVLVDIHPTYNSDPYNPDRLIGQTGLFRRYTDLVGRFATVLADMGEGIAFELMNEPPGESVARWREQTLVLAQAARENAPHLPLVITGLGGGYQELCAMTPLPASLGPLIYTFHYYEPGLFTHQTQIDSARYVTGLEWPPQQGMLAAHVAAAERRIAADHSLSRAARTRAVAATRDALETYYERNRNAATIAAAFDEVAAWADQHQIPRDSILLGEFGVVRTHWQYTGAKEPSRLAYLEAVRREAESRDFGWAVWTYRGWGGMAITTFGDPLRFDLPTLRALGLNA